MSYGIEFSPEASEQFDAIRDNRVKRKLRERITKLADDPLLQGEPLEDELKGYLSIRAVGQRYRVIYRVEEDRVIVLIFWLGMRREGSPDDVYVEATKAVRRKKR